MLIGMSGTGRKLNDQQEVGNSTRMHININKIFNTNKYNGSRKKKNSVISIDCNKINNSSTVATLILVRFSLTT